VAACAANITPAWTGGPVSHLWTNRERLAPLLDAVTKSAWHAWSCLARSLRMIDRHLIGTRTAPTRVLVDAWRASSLQAIGETDPVYWDAAAARAAAIARVRCPPPS